MAELHPQPAGGKSWCVTIRSARELEGCSGVRTPALAKQRRPVRFELGSRCWSAPASQTCSLVLRGSFPAHVPDHIQSVGDVVLMHRGLEAIPPWKRPVPICTVWRFCRYRLSRA